MRASFSPLPSQISEDMASVPPVAFSFEKRSERRKWLLPIIFHFCLFFWQLPQLVWQSQPTSFVPTLKWNMFEWNIPNVLPKSDMRFYRLQFQCNKTWKMWRMSAKSSTIRFLAVEKSMKNVTMTKEQSKFQFFSSGTNEDRAKRDPSLCNESVNGHFWGQICV